MALTLATRLMAAYTTARMKRIFFIVGMALLTACAVQAQLNGVMASLQLGQEQYLPDEDLQLTVKIVNRSGQDVILGTENDWITFSVIGDDNFVCPKLGEMPAKAAFVLHSGEVGTRALNPTPYFDFHRPGRYHLTAHIKIPQWHQEIICHSVGFTVGTGSPLPNLGNLQFGLPLPPGATNMVPEVRKYSLLKVSYVDQLKLYFRLTDSSNKTLRVYPIAGMTSFSDPEAQIDRYNNLHVLHQIGARAFNYSIINPNGQMVVRQTYDYGRSRPSLRVNEDGRVFVGGGFRHYSPSDYPLASANRQ
jgi:hypothetical protein